MIVSLCMIAYNEADALSGLLRIFLYRTILTTK